MGREIKRVPVSFDWPLNKTWGGYLRPDFLDEQPCAACNQSGHTAARRWVAQVSRLLLMLDDDLRSQELGRGLHPYLVDTGSCAWGVRPSADIAEFGEGLAGRSASFLGHDAIDGWNAEKNVIAAAGLDADTWGICPSCGGHGSTEKYPTQRVDAEAWEPTEPPIGDGWQLWETVSEGSPISPVFATDEGLIGWLCSDAYRMGISTPMQPNAARAFVRAGWAPSMVGSAAGLVPGEQFVGSPTP